MKAMNKPRCIFSYRETDPANKQASWQPFSQRFYAEDRPFICSKEGRLRLRIATAGALARGVEYVRLFEALD